MRIAWLLLGALLGLTLMVMGAVYAHGDDYSKATYHLVLGIFLLQQASRDLEGLRK